MAPTTAVSATSNQHGRQCEMPGDCISRRLFIVLAGAGRWRRVRKQRSCVVLVGYRIVLVSAQSRTS